MLPLACPEAESTSSADQKIRATPQTRRHQQTCKQHQITSVRLDSGLSDIRRRNGKEHAAEFCRGCSVTCHVERTRSELTSLDVGQTVASRTLRNDLRFVRCSLRMTNGAALLTDRCSFRGQRTGSRTIFMCFTEQLADHVFYRHFLHVYVADVARLEKFPAGFRNLCARNLQLHRDRCLFGDFAKRRQITCSFFSKVRLRIL